MPDYVNDALVLPYPKNFLRPIPANADLTRYISKDDWNALVEAVNSLRAAILDGNAFGLTRNASRPSTPNLSTDFLWLRNDGTWFISAGGVDTAIGSSGPSGALSVFTCLAGVTVNQLVYISGADAVSVSDNTTPPALGFVQTKPTSTQAIVFRSGELGGFSGLVPGSVYFTAATPGAITNDVSAFAPGKRVQRLGMARNTTTLIVEIDPEITVL